MKAYYFQEGGSWRPDEGSVVPLQVLSSESELKDLMEQVRGEKISSVGIYLGPKLGSDLLKESWLQPAEVSFLKVCDSVFASHGNWVPRSIFKVALKELIHLKSPDLSLRHAGYVAGCGVTAKIASSVLIEQGFKRLGVICADDAQGQALVSSLEKLYFGVQFQLIPLDQITLAPSDGSLLVNTLSEQECPGIFEDLSYLNFLSGKSLVINCRADQAEAVLEKEAGYLGSSFVSGSQFSGQVFDEFVKELGRHSSQNS